MARILGVGGRIVTRFGLVNTRRHAVRLLRRGGLIPDAVAPEDGDGRGDILEKHLALVVAHDDGDIGSDRGERVSHGRDGLLAARMAPGALLERGLLRETLAL